MNEYTRNDADKMKPWVESALENYRLHGTNGGDILRYAERGLIGIKVPTTIDPRLDAVDMWEIANMFVEWGLRHPGYTFLRLAKIEALGYKPQ